MMQNGQVFRIQNQERNQLREQMTLPNGTVVNPDGTVQSRDRKQFQLRDGECLDMEGRRYATQERFREKMEQRHMERLNKMDRMNRAGGREKMSAERKGGGKS